MRRRDDARRPAALEKLGVKVPAEDSHPFGGVRFLSAGLAVDAAFPNGASGRGVRRTVLHQLIAERAASLGIDFLWRTPVTGVSEDGVHLSDRVLKAHLDYRCGRGQLASAPMGWARRISESGLSLRVSEALPDCTVDQSHGAVLGTTR